MKKEVIQLGNGFIEVNGKKYKDTDSKYVLTPKQYKEIKDLKENFQEFLQQADFDEKRRIYFIPALYVERIEQLLKDQQ